jgi:hypothetical protein
MAFADTTVALEGAEIQVTSPDKKSEAAVEALNVINYIMTRDDIDGFFCYINR